MSLLVVVDVVWFAHRMACTYSTVKLVLYGQVAYIECRPVRTGARHRFSLTTVHYPLIVVDQVTASDLER